MKKPIILTLAAMALSLCSCSNEIEQQPEVFTAEPSAEVTTVYIETEPPFSETMEELPPENELSPADPLEALQFKPSGVIKPGVWLSSYTDDTGNFYIFKEDGIHGRFIPIADAEGVDFTYIIDGSGMTLYVGEELTPYDAELEIIDEDNLIIHMTFLGTQDELTYMAEMSPDGFSFYPAKMLAALAREYYEQQTGQKIVGVDYRMYTGDMVVLNLYVHDRNGWRSDVESYTVSMFTAKGWSSVSCEPVDFSSVKLPTTEEHTVADDIPDVVLPESWEVSAQE